MFDNNLKLPLWTELSWWTDSAVSTLLLVQYGFRLQFSCFFVKKQSEECGS